MNVTCRGLCDGKYTKRSPDYIAGDRYCRSCRRAWRNHLGLHCPCCGQRMQSSPRGREAKERYRAAGGHKVAEANRWR